MVLRVLDALKGAEEIGGIVLCGPRRSAVDQEPALRARIASGEVQWVKHQATPSSSAYHVLQALPADTPVLVTTADHALLSSRIVNYFCSEARSTGCDVVAGLASYDLVAAKYPENRRTATRLRGGTYCSCNLFACLTVRARRAVEFWTGIEKHRKKPIRVISAFGLKALLRYLLGRLTLAEGLQRISRRMGLRAGAVIIPFPEAAVDVDTIDDWRLAEAIVAKGMSW
jgi:GTP:adenosylcobinamide-phosphate guanylyltransferase